MNSKVRKSTDAWTYSESCTKSCPEHHVRLVFVDTSKVMLKTGFNQTPTGKEYTVLLFKCPEPGCGHTEEGRE